MGSCGFLLLGPLQLRSNSSHHHPTLKNSKIGEKQCQPVKLLLLQAALFCSPVFSLQALPQAGWPFPPGMPWQLSRAGHPQACIPVTIASLSSLFHGTHLPFPLVIASSSAPLSCWGRSPRVPLTSQQCSPSSCSTFGYQCPQPQGLLGVSQLELPSWSPLCTELQLCWEQGKEPWNNSCAVHITHTMGQRGSATSMTI